jgi:hypothetical protein
MTPAEKLAWAEANGVTPPAEFLAELETKGCSTCSCCCKSKPKAKKQEAEQAAAAKAETDNATELNWVVGIRALQCQGLSTEWLSSGAITAPPLILIVEFIESAPQALRPFIDSRWESILSLPAVPPPRLA